MKILLCGVFTPSSTDSWKARALSRLGHRVTLFPYRERDWRELFPIGEPWDLVFVSKGVPLPAEAFARLAEISKARLLWWPDPFENWTEDLTEAVRSGWPLSTTSSMVFGRILKERLKAGPHGGYRRILEGCDCEGPRPEWAPATVKPALLHFGHLSERRVQVIERLRAAGIQVDHLDQPLYGAALQRKVLEYAAVLGVNTSPDLYSNRVQTVLAMGGLAFQEDAPGLDEDFGCEREVTQLVTWSDGPLLETLAREVCARPRGVDFSRLAALTFAHHRWERAMQRALDFACPEASEMRFTASGSTGGTPAGDQIGPVPS